MEAASPGTVQQEGSYQDSAASLRDLGDSTQWQAAQEPCDSARTPALLGKYQSQSFGRIIWENPLDALLPPLCTTTPRIPPKSLCIQI